MADDVGDAACWEALGVVRQALEEVQGRGVALLLALLVCQGISVRGAEASPVNGTWIIRDLALDCQNQVCGRIAGVRDPHRRSTQCGRTIVWGLSPDGPSKWTNGSIVDPDDGATYRLSAILQPDGALQARIYKGVPLFGRTEILRRIDPRSIADQC
jgi:hypothetical protein